MKKIVLILSVLLLILNLTTVGFCYSKDNQDIEEKIYINHFPIPYYEFSQDKYIKIDDFKSYGFSVEFNEDKKRIDIIKNPYLLIQPIDTTNYCLHTDIVYSSDIKVYINNCIMKANKINNELVINVESFSDLNNCKFTDNDNCINIILGSKSLLSCQNKNTIHISKKGNDLYSDGVKIGYVKDNIEWLSIIYLGKKFEFDNLGGTRNRGTWNEYAEKGKYRLRITIEEEDNEAVAYMGWGDIENIYRNELLEIPDIGEDIYIPLVDLIQFMNIEIVRDYDLSRYIDVNDCNGNTVNGMNVISYNDWIYYINQVDHNKLYKMKSDMSKNTKICDDYISQFCIDNDEIYYINLNEQSKGLCKINIDGSNKTNIVEGEISYLNVSKDRIYYCDGLKGGSLYEVNKKGKNKNIVIQDKVIYPNIIGDWIYYINTSDRNTIYKITTDGKYNFKINNKFARTLNVGKNKIYFSNYNGTYFMNNDGSFENIISYDYSDNILIGENYIFLITDDKIIKHNQDNGYLEKIYEIDSLNGIGLEEDELYLLEEKYSQGLYIYNPDNDNKIMLIGEAYDIETVEYPYIYYKVNDDNLVKYNIENEKSEIVINKNFYELYGIIDDYIYYSDILCGLCKIKLDGTDKSVLTDTSMARVTVDESGIYYLESYFGSIEDFYKINLDGSGKKTIIDDLDKGCHFAYCIYEDYIYYPQRKGLYRIKTDGTDKSKLCDKYIYNFIINDDYIYYQDGGEVYRLKIDGKNEEKIPNEGGDYCFSIYNNELLYIKTKNDCSELYRYNLKTKEIKIIDLEQTVNLIGLDDKYLYMINYKDDSEALYQLNLDTDEKIKISNSELMNSYNFYGDKVIYLNEAYENNLIVK